MGIQIIQDGILRLHEYTSLDEASLKVVICALLSYPFGVIFKRLPDRQYTLKNIFVVLVSSFYIFGVLNLYDGLYTLLISSLGCYFITRYVRTSTMPWINFLFLMSHLAFNHVHNQFFQTADFTKIDITGAQMVLVMKLSAFGWSVYDAKQPKELLSLYNKSRVIRKHPNILPYLGYVFFFASVLTGPAFDYADYDKFIHSTLFDDVPDSKRPGRKVKRKIPRSGRQSMWKLAQGIFWAVCLVLSSRFVSLDYVFNSEFVTKHYFVYRIFYLWVLGFSHRLKYYAIWLIAEGSCILCGIGYNGYDAETDSFKWNRVQNIDPYSFETGQNVHICLESWNMNTNKWLKNYVYFRVAKAGKKPGFKSTLFTFVTSAFWHGTRPGYYLSFVMGAFLQSLGKIYRRNFRPMFLNADGSAKPTKKLYDIVCYIVTQLAFGYIVQPFVILDFKKSIWCWSTVYFYVNFVIAITFFAFKGPYGKQVTAWCKSYHPVVEVKKVKDEEPTKKRVPLSVEEREKVTKLVGHITVKEETEVPSLGLPLIEAFQEMNKEEFDQDMKELGEVWTSFRGRRKSIHDDDFEGLKDAYNNFKEEINDIFQAQVEKKEDLKALNKKKEN